MTITHHLLAKIYDWARGDFDTVREQVQLIEAEAARIESEFTTATLLLSDGVARKDWNSVQRACEKLEELQK